MEAFVPGYNPVLAVLPLLLSLLPRGSFQLFPGQQQQMEKTHLPL